MLSNLESTARSFGVFKFMKQLRLLSMLYIMFVFLSFAIPFGTLAQCLGIVLFW